MTETMNHSNEVLDILHYIRDRLVNDMEMPEKGGICPVFRYCIRKRFGVNDWVFLMEYKLYCLIKCWPDIWRCPDGKSDMTYPVGGKSEYGKEFDNGTLWSNPRRIALLNWLIDTLEKAQ